MCNHKLLYKIYVHYCWSVQTCKKKQQKKTLNKHLI